jgi:electron transfer flavoprotein beta subunit
MKVVVCVTLAPDTEQLAEIEPEDVGGDLGVTMVLNAWDEFAVEEALLLQERFGGETAALTVGSDESVEALKRAVAMGIEEGIRLADPAFQGSDAWGTAAILAAAIRQMSDEVRLVLAGRASVDGGSGLVGAGLAATLGWPYVSAVSRILEVTDTHATVRRGLDEGVQTVRVRLPAVLAVSKEINEPRYPNFVGIRKASRMEYPVLTAADLPLPGPAPYGESAARLIWAELQKPPRREVRCEMMPGATPVEQAAALVERLVADKVV